MTESLLAVHDELSPAQDEAFTDGKRGAVRGLGELVVSDESVDAGHPGAVPFESAAEDATGGSGLSSGGEYIPPGGGSGPERREEGRRIIGSCDFQEYFKLATFGEEWADASKFGKIYGIEQAVYPDNGESELGEHGYYLRLLIRELRNNYYEHCAIYIYAGVDSGHRLLIVSQGVTSGDIFIDYFDEDEVTSKTFNVYAKAFGQDEELIPGQKNSAAVSAGEELHEGERIASVTELDEVSEEAVEDLLVHGNARQQGDIGEGGRGIPLMLKYTERHVIERYGPGGRGGHLHLMLKREIPSEFDIEQLDLGDLELVEIQDEEDA